MWMSRAKLACSVAGAPPAGGHGLPVRILDVGIEFSSRAKQLDAGDVQVGAAVPDFPGDFEFSAFRLPQQGQDVIAAHAEIKLLEEHIRAGLKIPARTTLRRYVGGADFPAAFSMGE